ncbi:MAG: hypothetical protein ACLFUB_07270 [Cyclobacteriaceae bacterium]
MEIIKLIVFAKRMHQVCKVMKGICEQYVKESRMKYEIKIACSCIGQCGLISRESFYSVTDRTKNCYP